MPGQRALLMILARNLLAANALPAFLLDDEGTLVYLNDAGGAILGRPFEEIGSLRREEWNLVGPLDPDGNVIPSENLPLTLALESGIPGHGRFHMQGPDGLIEIETSALPLVDEGGRQGAMVYFWAAAGDDE